MINNCTKPIYYWSKLLIKLRGSAVIGSSIHPTSKIESGSHIVNSSFDRYSFCGYNCKIINCEVGSFVSIADNAVIGGARHPIEWASTSPVFYEGRDSIVKKFSRHELPNHKPTIIGSDVWIGDRAMIKAGVEIGHGAVIGMGSVVTKNVLPYTIVGGNPAKLIRMRFDNNVIERLLTSRWWEKSDQEIEVYAKNVKSIEQFLRELEKR